MLILGEQSHLATFGCPLSNDLSHFHLLCRTADQRGEACLGYYREGDAVELISMPTYDAATDRTTARFLAHGVRWVQQGVGRRHISMLRPGDQLELRPKPRNITNSNVIQMTADEVGWVACSTPWWVTWPIR
ncbi:hypothetical protein NJB1604_06100 [Mycobacterium marinum]|nr:hypothetical protein NJB1604_06100 [Mycobacterium marinum]